MRAHIVYAHPEPKSFCCAMKDTVYAALSETGHKTTISDLYAEHFNPVASGADFTVRRDPRHLSYVLEQRHAITEDALAPDIDREVKRLLAADLLVLIFPVYWFSAPAIMKGWIDRVFLPGLMYGGRRFYDRGPMAGRRALIVASMNSERHMFGADAPHGEMEPMFRHLTRGTLAYVGYTVLNPFWAFQVPFVADDKRRSELDRLRGHLTALGELAGMSAPETALPPFRCRPSRPRATK
jgi:NAD(P)H dehydrogenase (quinone)